MNTKIDKKSENMEKRTSHISKNRITTYLRDQKKRNNLLSVIDKKLSTKYSYSIKTKARTLQRSFTS